MAEAKFCLKCGAPLVLRADGGRDRKACLAEGCGYVHYDNPVPVVAAIVEHEGDIILARNKGWPENWFGLITGFLERGESPEDGIVREIQEELGLTGRIEKFVGVYPFEPMNQIIVAYHVRASGTVVVGDELAAIKRVSPAKLRPWPLGTGQAVADWLASRGV